MIPIATTTVTVKGVRPQLPVDRDSEGYPDDSTPTPVALVTGLRATISKPAFKRHLGEIDQADVYALRTDPFDITRFDIVVDESDGTEYEVTQAGPSKPVSWGLMHTVAYIRAVKGQTSGGDTGGTAGY